MPTEDAQMRTKSTSHPRIAPKTRPPIYGARVYVKKTNRRPTDQLDVARRQADHLGPVGIAAKKGQTNAVFRKKGYLRFVFPTRAMRERYVTRVEENCDSAIEVWRFKQ
jgi:hypothetical protein